MRAVTLSDEWVAVSAVAAVAVSGRAAGAAGAVVKAVGCRYGGMQRWVLGSGG